MACGPELCAGGASCLSKPMRDAGKAARTHDLKGNKKTARISRGRSLIGAESRNRTGTLFPARDFESRASTYSAISATQRALSSI